MELILFAGSGVFQTAHAQDQVEILLKPHFMALCVTPLDIDPVLLSLSVSP